MAPRAPFSLPSSGSFTAMAASVPATISYEVWHLDGIAPSATIGYTSLALIATKHTPFRTPKNKVEGQTLQQFFSTTRMEDRLCSYVIQQQD